MISTKENTQVLMSHFLKVEENSRTPKYMQIVNTILSDIECGIFKIGERIPSINETSIDFYLSRDTVEKAYRILKNQGIICPVRGKGYYVTSSGGLRDLRVLMIMDEMADDKRQLVEAFQQQLGEGTRIDIVVHNGNNIYMEECINANLGKYNYYLIMPLVNEVHATLIDTINKVPEDQLIILSHELEGINGRFGSICEDYLHDIAEALQSVHQRVMHYKNIKLIFRPKHKYADRLKEGFVRYCEVHNKPYEIMQQVLPDHVVRGDLFILQNEDSLVQLLELCEERNLTVGRDIGIISQGDHRYKEILHGGIATISTDFERMGQQAARFIQDKSLKRIKNPFALKARNSF